MYFERFLREVGKIRNDCQYHGWVMLTSSFAFACPWFNDLHECTHIKTPDIDLFTVQHKQH